MNTSIGNINVSAYSSNTGVATGRLTLNATEFVYINAPLQTTGPTINSVAYVLTTPYTFTTLRALPSMVLIKISNPVIYLPSDSSSLYNGMTIEFRSTQGFSGFTIQVTGGLTRFSNLNASTINVTVISASYYIQLIYMDGNWYPNS
jgi:hypothetical protein